MVVAKVDCTDKTQSECMMMLRVRVMRRERATLRQRTQSSILPVGEGIYAPNIVTMIER